MKGFAGQRNKPVTHPSPRRRVGDLLTSVLLVGSGSAGVESAKVGRALPCDLWRWATVVVFQSTQVADGTPPPSLVSTKPRCAPGHRPAAVTPRLEAQPAPFDEPPGHCGWGWGVTGWLGRPPGCGPPPPLCIANSVLGRGGGPKETLAQACVLSLVPAGHPDLLPCVVGEQGHAEVLGGLGRLSV